MDPNVPRQQIWGWVLQLWATPWNVHNNWWCTLWSLKGRLNTSRNRSKFWMKTEENELTIIWRYFCIQSWITLDQIPSDWASHHVVWFSHHSLTKGFFVQGRLTLDPAWALDQDLMLQRWAALCKLIIKAKSNDPFLFMEPVTDTNHVQLSHGHSTFQAGESSPGPIQYLRWKG